MTVLARWWPLPAAVAAALVVQQVAYTGRYDVGGHAAEHLSSGWFVFLATVVAGVLLWTTPSARRDAVVLIGLAGWLAAGMAILVGNVRVVDALVDAGQGRTPTDSLRAGPAVGAAHHLADTAPLYAVIAALVIVLGLYLRRAISRRLGIVAAVLNVLFPPWIVPGLGVVVVAAARCVARERADR